MFLKADPMATGTPVRFKVARRIPSRRSLVESSSSARYPLHDFVINFGQVLDQGFSSLGDLLKEILRNFLDSKGFSLGRLVVNDGVFLDQVDKPSKSFFTSDGYLQEKGPDP